MLDGHRRRHRGRDRHGPRAAPRRREAGRVRSRAVRDRRARDLRAAGVRSARPRRPHRRVARDRAALDQPGAGASACPAARSPTARRADITILATGRAGRRSTRRRCGRNRRTRRSTAGNCGAPSRRRSSAGRIVYRMNEGITREPAGRTPAAGAEAARGVRSADAQRALRLRQRLPRARLSEPAPAVPPPLHHLAAGAGPARDRCRATCSSRPRSWPAR